jgi:hypothetical protein
MAGGSRPFQRSIGIREGGPSKLFVQWTLRAWLCTIVRARSTERLRLSGSGDQPACAGHGDDAGEQPDVGGRRDAAALPDPERGRSSRRGSITFRWPDHIVVISAGAAGLTGNADMGFIRGSSDLVGTADSAI